MNITYPYNRYSTPVANRKTTEIEPLNFYFDGFQRLKMHVIIKMSELNVNENTVKIWE